MPGPRSLSERFSAAVQRSTSLSLSLESFLWILLIVAAVLTRFWDLGYRALHHDESLHAYYSWVFSNGSQPYVHHPLMHGPFLFHMNALVYLMFGASDATSRFAPALTGVAIVALPWLLRGRRFLGPWGALAAGFMLLISPSFLYYTRYIRHDPYTALGSLLLAIAIFRYLERPQRRWMITAFVCVGFLFSNHEIVYAILLGFVMLLWGALVWGRFRPLVPVHIVAFIALAFVAFLHKTLDWAPFPAIPWETASQAETARFYEHLLFNPFTLSVLFILAAAVVASVMVLRRHYAKEARKVGYLEAMLGGTNPGTVEYGLLHMVKDRTGLLIGAGTGVFITVALFTTLFTNMH
ncbi:MAG: TIGR03663 family protein, partial [Thermomicrobiales bacterium]